MFDRKEETATKVESSRALKIENFTNPKTPSTWCKATENISPLNKKGKCSKLTQTYLDFGQKNFFPIRCSICGLVYTPGKIEDEKLHDEYHGGPPLPRYYSSSEDIEVFKDGKWGCIVRMRSSRMQGKVSFEQ